MALTSGLGAEVEANPEYTAAQWWFGEDQGRYVISVPDTEALNHALAKGTENAETAQIGFRRIRALSGYASPSAKAALEAAILDGWPSGLRQRS